MKKRCFIPFLTLVLLLAGSLLFENTKASGKENTGIENSDESLSQLIIIFSEDRGALNRKYNVESSPEYFERFEQFYSDWSSRLEAIDFDALPHEEKVDYKLLQNLINSSAYFLEAERRTFESIRHWLPDVESIMELVNERRIGLKPDGQSVAQSMHNWKLQVEELMQEMRNQEVMLRHETIALDDALSELQSGISYIHDFYMGYDIEYTWWADRAYEALDEAFEEYRDFVSGNYDASAEQMDESGIVGNPIGAEEIARRIEFEMISYSAEELIEIAEHQFAKIEVEMRRISNALGYGDDWHAALEHAKQRAVPVGEKPELILRLHHESVDFLNEHDLITIPDLVEETWRMGMMSPQRQRVNPFFTGGEQITISYPTNTMEHDEKLMSMRGNNPHFNRATVHHELIPGHHLQGFMTRRYSTHRGIFSTPFWGEGWALYWELLLWDLGFAETLEDEIGMLFWRSHRYARIIFSLNYHLGNWTPQQSIDYLVERVGHEYANAEAEVRRSFAGSYDPMYQVAYMIGGMQFYALYKDLVDTGIMTAKEYHDIVLKSGRMPVRMVKSIVTEEELQRDDIEEWDFADYIW